MGFIKKHTDERDVTYPESYWRVVNINIDVKHKSANFTFEGHKDKAARDNNKVSVSSKSYSINGDEFDKRFLDCMGDSTMNKEFPDNKQRYAVCMNKWKTAKKKTKGKVQPKWKIFQILILILTNIDSMGA